MGDENPIRTLGDYSRHNYKGYRNTIELPDGNNVVLLRSDTIRLVQNGCLFHRLRSEDPNQHLKDFLKLVDSLDLDVQIGKGRACLYFNFPFTIKLGIGLNVFQQDPSPPGRILEDLDGIRGVSNFTGRIGGMHIFVGNFTYVLDFMIVEDISSVIDLRFTNRIEEISYKMPHKIEKYNSLSDLEKEHTKLVYFRNEEDKRRGVEYVMSKILGFYKECLELGPKYLTGLEDEGGIT
ncbi:hypothetical protein Tco_1068436 [Tanacetum coccineum]|uniref:MAK10-like protein n=1 Tax=Tanacetum coccineum TaxID=301880 RepID=A0ABQ5HGK4_9ASTR